VSRGDRSVAIQASARKGKVTSDDMDVLDVCRVRGMTGTSRGCVGDVGTKRVFELPRGLRYKRNIIGTMPLQGGIAKKRIS
jgi:hypothetical protein